MSIIVCDKCCNEFQTSVINIDESDVDIGQKKFSVLFFRCPKCNKAYVVRIADERFLELQDEYVKAKEQWEKYGRLTNEENARKQYAILLAKKNRLDNKHKVLMQRYGDLISVNLDAL